MDRIEIAGLRAYGRHGVEDREGREGQTFVVDLLLDVDLAAAAASDDLADTIHYGVVAEEVVAVVEHTRYALIEALAAHIADVVLRRDGVRGVTVRVAKPHAPIAVPFDSVAVSLTRQRT